MNMSQRATVTFLPGTGGSLTGTTVFPNLIIGVDAFPTAPGVNANIGWNHLSWTPALPANTAGLASGNNIFTATYEMNESERATVRFLPGAVGSLPGQTVFPNLIIGVDPFPTAPTMELLGWSITGWSPVLPSDTSGLIPMSAGTNDYTAQWNFTAGGNYEFIVTANSRTAVFNGAMHTAEGMTWTTNLGYQPAGFTVYADTSDPT